LSIDAANLYNCIDPQIGDTLVCEI